MYLKKVLFIIIMILIVFLAFVMISDDDAYPMTRDVVSFAELSQSLVQDVAL